MSEIAFDLISDLHVETWQENFNWDGKSTSMLCVVAGDVSKDHELVIETLAHLSKCYKMVLYIDGNDEHRYYLDNIRFSYKELYNKITAIPNVTYLHDNVVVVDGVAFIGANGWWTYDFNPNIDYNQTKQWFKDHYQVQSDTISQIESMALHDYTYVTNTIERLQTYPDVKRIVIVTHTVPSFEFIEHDLTLVGSNRQNVFGNSLMRGVLAADHEHKINTWCFGHYHGSVERQGNNIRYINNCRGKGDTFWHNRVYHPKRIVISY